MYRFVLLFNLNSHRQQSSHKVKLEKQSEIFGDQMVNDMCHSPALYVNIFIRAFILTVTVSMK